MLFSPCDELVGKQGRMAELDSEFLCAGILDELFQDGKIGEGWRELEEVVMDEVFHGCEECFEPLETRYSWFA